MLDFWRKLRSKKFLGIDIGTFSIRVVELGKKDEKWQLENYGELDISNIKRVAPGKPKEVVISLSEQDIAEAIQAICKQAKIRTREVNFSIPDFRSFFTSFKMPAMAKEELPEAIKYEVRPYVPLPLSEITLDWLITEGKPSKTSLKVLVVAIPNEVIKRYQEIARLSGLKLKILEPEVFALTRALARTRKTEEVIGLIDIGVRTTTCSIIEQRTLKRSNSFSIGANELTERLARSLNISYNKAKELREKYGLSSPSASAGPEALGAGQSAQLEKQEVKEALPDIRQILVPLVDSLLGDIKKAFRNFYREEGKEVEKIILAGGLAWLPGLKEYFFKELRKEVIISNPFLEISYPPILNKTLEKIGPSYVIGVGLAMKGLE